MHLSCIFVECSSIRIILSLATHKERSRIYWYLIPPNATTSSMSIHLLHFFWRGDTSLAISGQSLRWLDGKGTPVLYIELKVLPTSVLLKHLWGWLTPPSHRRLPAYVPGCGFLCCFWVALWNLSSRSLWLKISIYRSSPQSDFCCCWFLYVPFSLPSYYCFYFLKFLLE